MVIAVIKVDGFFWEIKKEKKQIEITKVEENVLEKIYTNVPCLVSDTKGLFTRYMIFDKNEDNATIENTGAALLETKSYYTFIEEYQDKKIAFYLKKTEVVKLFKEFAFSKIIPLDIVLLRIALKYKAEIVGIIGKKYFSYSRKISFDNVETFFANEGEHSSLLFEPNANISFFLEAISKMLHIKKTIFSDKEIDKNELIEKNITQISLEDFLKIINHEKNFVILDKFSDNYQSKIYKKFLIGTSIIMLAFAPYFFYKYIEVKTKNAYYESVYSNLQKKLNQIKQIEKKYKIDYLYKIYRPFNFNEFYRTVENIAYSPEVISYSYVKKEFPRELPTQLKVTIKGINNFLAFQKKFKNYIQSYKINPKNKTIRATLLINSRNQRTGRIK